MALKQACSTDCHRAQGAFKDSMIHGILQFTLPIAFRCVLHRWENQEIRCRKLCIVCWPVTVQPSSTFILTIRVCSKERASERPSQRKRSTRRIALLSLLFLFLSKCPFQGQCTRVCGCIVGVGGQGHFLASVWPAQIFTNDPSAGSPTETLLRLLLPLNDQVCLSFQRPATVAGTSCQSQRLTKPFNR